MADTFKKIPPITPMLDDAPADSWKNIEVEKEHQPPQPEKVLSRMTYRNLEQQLNGIEDSITSLTEQKTVLEAEMVKVKAAAEA